MNSEPQKSETVGLAQVEEQKPTAEQLLAVLVPLRAKFNKLEKDHKEAVVIGLAAIKQRDEAQSRVATLEAQHKGYEDLRAALSRRLKDANLRNTAELVIKAAELKVELKKATNQRDNLSTKVEDLESQIDQLKRDLARAEGRAS